MSLPPSQVTGAATESAVETLFLSWGWNVGRDRIDDGYDLHVTPTRDRYKGFRFSVQVKGTVKSKTKGSVSAQVSKPRLRQYSEDFDPVFIVRATSDGELYWIHAQVWAQAHKDKISGSGRGTVKFEPSKTLKVRKKFEKYLLDLFQSPPYVDAAPSSNMHESFYLNSLDPRLKVKIKNDAAGKAHEIYATQESVTTQISFVPKTSEENIKSLREAIEFGLPRSVQVENFNLAGSPLLDEIFQGPLTGALSINSRHTVQAKVHLVPGRKVSIMSTILSLEVERFNGAKGVVFTNERTGGCVDISIRLRHKTMMVSAEVDIRLGDLGANSIPARDMNFLRELGEWADQVIAKDYFSIEISVLGLQLPLLSSASVPECLLDFIYLSDAVRKIHLIAKATKSNLTFHSQFAITGIELEEIELAYALLKGESRLINVGVMEVTPREGFGISDCQDMDMLVCTTLRVKLFEQLLCSLPISVELIGFQFEVIPGSSTLRFTQGPQGVARATYDEDRR